ncbi:MAG: hypothetical protein FJX76_01195 [Armatimonadetes bacterium]|nr:hypothetical protein [Armatimonadota bacterium]
MDKTAKDKIPAVLGLLMGLVGMTAMTVMGYLMAPEDGFSPRDIAVRASLAWGVMLVLGYIVGIYSKQFVPDLIKKNAVSIKTDEEGAGGDESGPKKVGEGASKASVAPTPAEGGGLNILLDETPQMAPAGESAAAPAGQAAIPAPPPSGVSIPAPQ